MVNVVVKAVVGVPEIDASSPKVRPSGIAGSIEKEVIVASVRMESVGSALPVMPVTDSTP